MNSLVNSIYPTSPQRDEDEPPIESHDEALKQLEGTVIERGRSKYYFMEYNWTRILKNFCCCCKLHEKRWFKERLFKYNRFQKAEKQLQQETDILNVLQN